ncbi:hypothetical protein [Paenibacillus hexagrammi]|uniref:Uncharacterized protein n=1 Tax=Paenibacillus hexagrammi TaxID=2908839 RepID=A0ABY3SP86_9BACL|nr:hypothetical protein [Paenibacillus sp. YPD9-1]UJF35774.1 hypothetical protein L0M14_12205 [Paenibacillus sp. YPD9-1]
MAFGISRSELNEWKRKCKQGEIAYLTHYWLDPRFEGLKTVTKVGCCDLDRLQDWCKEYSLNPAYIHHRDQYPHYDLLGKKQLEVLNNENLTDHLVRFKLI